MGSRGGVGDALAKVLNVARPDSTPGGGECRAPRKPRRGEGKSSGTSFPRGAWATPEAVATNNHLKRDQGKIC